MGEHKIRPYIWCVGGGFEGMEFSFVVLFRPFWGRSK
jgi:hypothetical protein